MAIIFCENINRKIEVPNGGVNLREALRAEGVRIYKWPRNYFPFGCGKSYCAGFCEIEVLDGAGNLNLPTGREQAKLGPDPKNRRLACQCIVNGDVTIRIRS